MTTTMARWVWRIASGSSRVVPEVYWNSARSLALVLQAKSEGNCASEAMKASSAMTTSSPGMPSASGCLLGIGQQQLRRAVVDAQAHAVRAEQREQRHRDGAGLHGAEQRRVEGQRRLQHDGDAVAGLHAARDEIMRHPGRGGLQAREGEVLVAAVGMGDAHRDTSGHVGVPIDAFMRDVQPVAIAIEQVPQLAGREVLLGVGMAGQVSQIHSEPLLGSGRLRLSLFKQAWVKLASV